MNNHISRIERKACRISGFQTRCAKCLYLSFRSGKGEATGEKPKKCDEEFEEGAFSVCKVHSGSEVSIISVTFHSLKKMNFEFYLIETIEKDE